jgi:hypothetical protein
MVYCIPMKVHVTYRRNFLPPTSGQKPNKQSARLKKVLSFHTVYLLRFSVYPEIEENVFLRNVGKRRLVYTSKLSQAVTFVTCIKEEPGSNIGRNILWRIYAMQEL